jgi:hypothetical protein
VNLFSNYVEIIAKDVGLSFAKKRDYAVVCSLFPSVMRLDWNATKQDFVRFFKELYSEDHIDAYLIVLKDGSYFHSNNDGNPFLGGRVSTGNENPDATLFYLTDRDHFKRLITNNPEGMKRTYVSSLNISDVTGLIQALFSSNIINEQGLWWATSLLRIPPSP